MDIESTYRYNDIGGAQNISEKITKAPLDFESILRGIFSLE